jgi:hypothetical protein
VSNAAFPVCEITPFGKSHNRPRVLVLGLCVLVLMDYIEVVVLRLGYVLGLFAPITRSANDDESNPCRRPRAVS